MVILYTVLFISYGADKDNLFNNQELLSLVTSSAVITLVA